MDTKKLKELLKILKESELEEVSLRTEDYSLRIKRSAPVHTQTVASVVSTPVSASAEQNKQKEGSSSAQEKSRYHTLRAPMIGTFYTAQDPSSAPFVKVGDSVSVGQTVCIIEAMKLFNEIEADVAGKVVEILVDNTAAVAYDEALILIDPS